MLFLLGAPALAAAQVPTLRPFDSYLGHCWVADLGDGATDRHCFSPVYEGAHVRDAHEVRRNGRIVYAGETLYSVEGEGITFTYWNSLGGVGRGSVTSEGGRLHFTLRMRASPQALPQDFEAAWKRTGDGYDVIDGTGTRHFRRAD